MKPIAFVTPILTVFRRCVRVLAFLVPAFLTSLAFAEPWTGTDIGNTGAAGSEGGWPPVPPNFTLTGAGADIQGTADSFRLMHIPVTGDVVAVTRAGFISSTHPWAKAGVMVRASLDPNSANVAMVLSPSQYCSFQVRSATGAATDVVLGPRITGAYWVKLTRVGNTFTGYISPNGTTWTQVGSREVVMPAPVHAGFAVCSHVVGTTMAASFNDADVNGTAAAPVAPSNVTATNVTPHSADITWTDNSNNEDGFRIYVWRSERHATYPEVEGTVAPNTTSFTITGMSSESYYYVYVAAFRSGTETASPTITVSTPQDPAEPPATPHLQYVRPPAPHTLDVHWTETGGMDSGYETGFELERSSDGSTFTLIATLGENVGGYRDTGLTAGTTYTYRVRAVKNTLYSDYSAALSAQAVGPLPAPTNLAVSNPTAHSLDLTWTDNSSDEQRFELQRAPAGGTFETLHGSLNANTTSFTDINVTPHTTYSYRLRAFSSNSVSDYSNVATGSTTDGENPMPPGWSGADIGATGLAGSENAHSMGFTVHAAGRDIQGTADSFRFVSQAVTGNAVIIARVASLTNTNAWAKAGVMIRASLAPGAVNAAMLLSPAQKSSFQARATTGGSTDVTFGPSWATPPCWVKLERAGNTVTAFVAGDGSSWVQVASREIPLPAQVYIGFAATSHDASIRTTAVFDYMVATSPTPPEPEWTQQAWGGATGSFTPEPSGLVSSLTATSGDIYNATDSGVFVHQPWSGPATFVTRVDAVGNSNAWAKAGLMFRASLEPNAANVFVALTPGTGAVLQSRPAPGAQTTTVVQNWSPRPGALLKLVRGGGTISAFFSTNNGTTWTALGSTTDNLPETFYVGYAASSHNPNAATTATFSHPE